MFARNVSMDLKLNALRESARMFEADVRPVLGKQSQMWKEITTGREFKGGVDQCRAFVRECWQRVCLMKAEFDRSNVAPNAAYADISSNPPEQRLQAPRWFLSVCARLVRNCGIERRTCTRLRPV